ncbi:MAG: sulfoxide reductase heme-binding subunit YedZ [Gammaproteobacteria bacterium]
MGARENAKKGRLARRLGKPLLFVLCIVPVAELAWLAYNGGLGANPIEYLSRATGDWTLRLLLITLAITPLRKITGWNGVMRFRRMLGLFAFFYATLHLMIYLVLDQFFAWGHIIEDIAERPYITIGFTAYLLLVPLALTSTNAAMRRLGGRRWQRLHRLAYVAALAGIVHFLWLVKADLTEPLVYLGLFAVLMSFRYRLLFARRGGRAATPAG